MDSGRVYGDSDMISMLANSSHSLWAPSSSPPFHETMVNFDQKISLGRRRTSSKTELDRCSDGEDTGGEEFDINSFHQPQKKRRLTTEQVQFLEKNFEMENKLEPERKIQLAKELGLQPRQVAIWFQNRRARYKTKQLEKDYDSLKAGYDRLKADYDSLVKERDHLQNEVKLLTKKLKQRDMGDTNLDPGSPDNPIQSEAHQPKMETNGGPKLEVVVGPPSNKQVEDASSAKSDVVDSESPHCMEAHHTSSLLDADPQSDFSQEEEDRCLMMSKSLLMPPTTTSYNNLLKVEEGFFDANNNGTCCNFSFVDEQPFWSSLNY